MDLFADDISYEAVWDWLHKKNYSIFDVFHYVRGTKSAFTAISYLNSDANF